LRPRLGVSLPFSLAHTQDALVCKHVPNFCYERTLHRIPELRNTSRRKLSERGGDPRGHTFTCGFAKKANHLLHARTNVCEKAGFFLIKTRN
jgi:hypothetical protein